MFKYKVNMISGKTHYVMSELRQESFINYIASDDFIKVDDGRYIITNHIESVKLAMEP